MRYIAGMVADVFRFKCIVAALVLGFGVSLPVVAQTDRLDQLFAELSQTDEAGSLRIEQQIIAEWGKSGSASIDLLLRRGQDALDDGEPDAALDHFSALVDHAPDFAEGYYLRATSFYLLDEIGPAMADLEEVLTRNPRHFEAMRGLAVMMEETGRPAAALALYGMILEIVPFSAEAQAERLRLQQQLEGQAI
ncbi:MULTISPECIES: tetratricopeptide repeat protein [unclassified Yoonia]|uniref:tetratricopeptide repeat protein n=1 Tax=unclassified Yoonia TaxID=2629118 RepID=UPI002AFFFC62|nr:MULTISPECIES: tetratricopeptide repeat protein [unclassified Yoonia]